MKKNAHGLIDMFEADRNTTAAKWYSAFPLYEIHGEVGAKPWWPALSRVWLTQGIPPKHEPAHRIRFWGEAWALLERLYDDYRDAGSLR